MTEEEELHLNAAGAQSLWLFPALPTGLLPTQSTLTCKKCL